MKRIFSFILFILFLLFIPVSSFGILYFRPAIGLTGGGTGSLDKIDGTALQDGDGAIVIMDNGGASQIYIYRLEDNAGSLSESSPKVITPDTNAGNKRWLLVTDKSYKDQELVFGNGSWTCDLNDDGNCTGGGGETEADFSTGSYWVQFDAGATSEYAISSLYRVPVGYNQSGASVTYVWSTAESACTVQWCLEYRTAQDSDWAAWSTADCTTDTSTGIDYKNLITDTSLTDFDDVVAGKLLQLRINRDTANDNCTGDARLDSVILTIGVN